MTASAEAICEWLDARASRHIGSRDDAFYTAAAAELGPSHAPSALASMHDTWHRRRRFRDGRLLGEGRVMETCEPAVIERLADSRTLEAPAEVTTAGRVLEWFIDFLNESLLTSDVAWTFLRSRALADGESADTVHGPGRCRTTKGLWEEWLQCAVLIKSGADQIIEAIPEARIRGRRRVGNRRVRPWVEIWGLHISGKRLSIHATVRKLAALILVLRGEGSGLRNKAELARVSGVSRPRIQVQEHALRELLQRGRSAKNGHSASA